MNAILFFVLFKLWEKVHVKELRHGKHICAENVFPIKSMKAPSSLFTYISPNDQFSWRRRILLE